MPIAFPPPDRSPTWCNLSEVNNFAVNWDATDLSCVGTEFMADYLDPGFALDYNTSCAINLRNMDYQYEAIDFASKTNPVPRPVDGSRYSYLQTDWAASNKAISGVSRGSTGTVLETCVIDLFATGSDQLIFSTVSDASGNFSFGNPGTGPFYIVAYKVGSPDVAGTTLNTLLPSPV